MGRVDIQLNTICVGQDRQSVFLELRYGRHATDFNRATTWWRTLWRNSEPHEIHFVNTHQPILKYIAESLRRRCLSLGGQRLLTVLALGVTYRRPPQHRLAGRVALRQEMPSSVEKGAVPGIPGGSCETKRRVEFAIADGGSDTSGWKSKREDDNPMKGYEAIQTRFAHRNKERENNAAGSMHVNGSKNKRVIKSHEAKSSGQEAHETRGRELTMHTSLLARALESIKCNIKAVRSRWIRGETREQPSRGQA